MNEALKLLSLAAVAYAAPRRLGATPSITVDGSESRPTGFALRKRVYVPYDNGTSLAFGMGAAEQAAYDPTNKYAYAVSEQGYVNVVDWDSADSAAARPDLFIDLSGAKLTDIELCVAKKLVIVAEGASDTVSNGKVKFYRLIERSSPTAPTLILEMTVGPLPDMILPNSDCSKVAVANEGEGKVIDGFLQDPEGSVDILTLTGTVGTDFAATKTSVSLGGKTDAELISMGVHLPLQLNAQTYWDETYGAFHDVNFTNSRAAYTSATQLEPEYLAWNADDTKLYVNLQENNAIATIDVASSSASMAHISALGMKDHGTVPIDVVEDSTTAKTSGTPETNCTQKIYSGFKALRMPDSIVAVQVDGTTYILTANEGDDKEYGSYEEKQKLKDVAGSDGALKSDWTGMTITNTAKATAAAVRDDASKMRITIGSAAIDFSDATAPVFQNVVAMGGRGISVYKEIGSGLSLEWDSQGVFEEKVCEHYPKSYNGIQDEEFSPKTGSGNDLYASLSAGNLKTTIDELHDTSEDGCTDGGDGNAGACPLGKTIDERSPKDGAGTEAIVAGTACGSLIAVTATEKQGVAFVYDITNITAPALLFVKHLSEISETKNPGVAYAARELGDIDPESMIFLEAADSPSGKAGVMFAGAWSGTLSFWEFTCPDATTTTATTTAPVEDASSAVSACATALALPLAAAALFYVAA